jgi:[ribosomal protein S5]-alanine N-acetyltransferase
MNLEPIDIAGDRTHPAYSDPACLELLQTYKDYYGKVGFNPPWIGYFVIRGNQVVGTCSFTGQPREGRVEIAYWTFKDHEGQGISSFSCRQLISISKETDPQIIITAKTLPESNPSTRILEKTGFAFSRIVQDEDIGPAWEWIYKGDLMG